MAPTERRARVNGLTRAAEADARDHGGPAHVVLAVHLGDALFADDVGRRAVAELDPEAQAAAAVVDPERQVVRRFRRAEGVHLSRDRALLAVRGDARTQAHVRVEARAPAAELVPEHRVGRDDAHLERMAQPEGGFARRFDEGALAFLLEEASVAAHEERLAE